MTREGLTYLVIATCVLGSSFVQTVNLLVLVFALMAAVFAVNMYVARLNLSGLHVVRRLPLDAFAGQPFEIEVEVFNSRRLSSTVCLTVRDGLGRGSSVQAATLLFPPIRPGEAKRATFSALAHQRGSYRLGPAAAISRFPLGLVERTVPIDVDDELIVFPRVGQLSPLWRSVSEVAIQRTRSRPLATQRTQEEYHGLREYREGDNPRHIHWRTSARRGELMIKEFEPEESHDILLLVEPWLPDATVERRNAVEVLVSFAATVCVDLCRLPGNRIVLAIAGNPPTVWSGQSSRRLLRELLRTLALVQGSPGADLLGCLSDLRAIGPRHLRTCVVSTRALASREMALARTDWLARSSWQYLNVWAGDLDRFFRVPER